MQASETDSNGRELSVRRGVAAMLLFVSVVTSAALLVSPRVSRADIDVPAPARRVVLLHGLIRSSKSMSTIDEALRDKGYEVCNISYPSRHHPIEVLASDYVVPGIARCFPDMRAPIDFVTHSMGGILVRQMAATGAVPSIGRVVMLGPPNAGSEIVDELGSLWLFGVINGPAGRQLGTTVESKPRLLGRATFEVGIIAGDRPRNWLLSRYLPGKNDGKVSVASCALDGMKDFVVMDANHTFMVRNREVIAQAVRFLDTGAFERGAVTVEAEDTPTLLAPVAAAAAAAVLPSAGLLPVATAAPAF